MRKETVEIYSDTTNLAVMKHPGRHFPGMLIQGDSLYSLCQSADKICKEIEPTERSYKEANELRNRLWSLLTHYKKVLTEHDMKFPFSEQD